MSEGVAGHPRSGATTEVGVAPDLCVPRPKDVQPALVRLSPSLARLLVPALGDSLDRYHAVGRPVAELEEFARVVADVVKRGQPLAIPVGAVDDGPVDAAMSKLSVTEAATMARVSAKTIRRRIGDGQLRSTRRGGRVLIDVADLVAWMNGEPT